MKNAVQPDAAANAGGAPRVSQSGSDPAWLALLGGPAVMKKLVIVMAVSISLVVVSCVFLHFAGRGSHRARFIVAMNELREANAALQKYGAFTNQFQGDVVSPNTNRFMIDGAVYQCAFAVESVDLHLRDRGFLAITTNDVFVWVDKKRGVIPLGNGPAFTFPPGL